MIIVTGGAGFIGSNLVKGLNDAGESNIVVVDNLSNASKHRNLNRCHIIDYLDKEDFLEKLPSLKNVRAIFHQGACSSTTETDGRYMMRNNFEYSRQLLHYALDHQIPFIYASSASVYGNGDQGFIEKRDSEYPLNVYAFSKWMFDCYVRRFLGSNASQILGLRYFNVYGYQENHKGSMASVACHLFQQFQENQRVKLFEGSEGFFRDFVFVEDVVKMNLFFWQQGTSGIFNCGTGKARSFLDVSQAFQAYQPDAIVETIPFPDHLVGKYQTFTEADLNHLKQAGYPCDFYSLEDGLQRYFERLEQSDGYL